MKKTQVKTIAWIVLLTFAAMLQVSQAPLRAAATGPTVAKAEESSFIEQEQEAPLKVAKKKFPWLIVLGAAVVAAAVIYFVVLNKKYTLTVSLGEGISGTPAAGSAQYKKNKTVSYNFSLQSGYQDLIVTLDGAPVAASGSLKMDKDHALAAVSTKVAVVAVNSTPAGAKIYDNGVDSGQVTNHVFTYNAPGTHKYIIRQCGYQDFEQQESAEMGMLKTVSAALVPGIYESFSVPAASCWQPYAASEWTVSGGAYRFVSAVDQFNYSLYKSAFNQSNLSAEVKMKRVIGNPQDDDAVVLIERMEGSKAFGYWFSYQANGSDFWIVRFDGWDMYKGNGKFKVLGNGKPTTLAPGLNQWNMIKIVRAGSNYAFYINKTLVKTVADSTYNPHYLALGVMLGRTSTQMQYDYVKLDFTGTAHPTAAAPATEPAIVKSWPELN
ncbi:MAG: PEGA domain-containing protein [Chrysiogenales bacterium]|nr:MAG: PEGA domain-containing protein [Chrysiogenales bacterium]